LICGVPGIGDPGHIDSIRTTVLAAYSGAKFEFR
jgi:hypothetical protein